MSSKFVEAIEGYQMSRGGMHRAGALSTYPLERIVWYFEDYFKGKTVHSVETGCGASTIVFSNYAQSHTVYAYDDRAADNSSVRFAQEFPGFRSDRTDWRYGPTQRTIFSQPLCHDVDMILIDGPHGYPFPELEYFAFYNRLTIGGILIVDDIHIPTINNFYEFLLQDDCFRSHGVAMTTAYFQRTDFKPFDMEGDDWWLQRYNVQSFPVSIGNPVEAGSDIPVKFSFEGKLKDAKSPLIRGFSFQDNCPLTEGFVSCVDLRLSSDAPTRLTIEMDITPICVDERLQHIDEVGVKVSVDTKDAATISFVDSRRQTIRVEAETAGTKSVCLEFWHLGLLSANSLVNFKKSAWFDGRLPSFWLHSLSLRQQNSTRADVNTVERTEGSIVSFNFEGKKISFFVNAFDDSVQTFHAGGRFYEAHELKHIRAAVPKRSRILEVGAHVGNHTIFYAKFMEARRIVCLEPNAHTRTCLRINCALNSAYNVDLSRAKYALGKEGMKARSKIDAAYNSGGATVVPDIEGDVHVVRGDDLFATESFDFVKVDVEGMELDVLSGLQRLIDRCRPVLFVEVKDENTTDFLALIKDWDYDIAFTSSMYSGLTNYLARCRFDRRNWQRKSVRMFDRFFRKTTRTPGS